jgi:hypothetical protein
VLVAGAIIRSGSGRGYHEAVGVVACGMRRHDDKTLGVEAMRLKLAVLTGSAVVAGATVLALTIHRTAITCAYLVSQPGSSCPSQAADYPLRLRIGIIVAGLIVAGLIASLGRILTYSRSSRLNHRS